MTARRRLAALLLSFAVLTGMGVALAPAASAGTTYSAAGNCFYGGSTNRWTPIKIWWERSSGGGSRHGYKAAFGDAAGSPNGERVYALNFWQSYTPFGTAINNSYIAYPNNYNGAYSYETPAQPSSRMPYFPNLEEMHLNLELTHYGDGVKCRREWRIYVTSAVRDG